MRSVYRLLQDFASVHSFHVTTINDEGLGHKKPSKGSLKSQRGTRAARGYRTP